MRSRLVVIHYTGTEPFWGGASGAGMATYSTPENPDGSEFPVERFAGNNGLGISGSLNGASFDLMITPGECSDGMSDRIFPYTATLLVGGEQRQGCAWTDSQPFSGPEACCLSSSVSLSSIGGQIIAVNRHRSSA